jgi:hypothetical protein
MECHAEQAHLAAIDDARGDVDEVSGAARIGRAELADDAILLDDEPS